MRKTRRVDISVKRVKLCSFENVNFKNILTDYKATFLLKLTHAQKIEIIIIHVLIHVYRKFYSNSFPST